MPTLFELFGIRFYFYSDEHLPIHVHIVNGDGRVNVEPEIEVVSNNGIKPKDIKKTLAVIETYRDEIINAWREYHGE